MKKLLLGLILATVGAVTASATIVTFSTSVDWDCTSYSGNAGSCFANNGAGTVTLGNLILTYTPTSPTVDAPESPNIAAVSFGQVVATCASPGACTSDITLTGLKINVDIAQTAPFGGAAGNGQFTGILSGGIHDNTSSGLMIFSPLSFTLTQGNVNVNYVLQQPNTPGVGDGYLLSAIQNNNPTSIQGYVNVTVPEPSSMVFVGSGLMGLAFLVRRRK